MRQELLKNGTDLLYLRVWDHGRAVTPSSATYRILGLAADLLEAGTVTGTSIQPGAGVVGQARQDCTVEWTYTVSGVQYKTVEQFDVVLWKLYPVASEADLVREAPSLVTSERVYKGTIASATSTTLVDKSLIGTREDWLGAVLQILTGNDAGGQYVVTAFNATTGTLTYAAAATASAAGTYLLRRSFQPELDAAWEDIYDRLVQQCSNAPGHVGFQTSRPFLIMTPDRLRRPHILLALSKAYRGIAVDTQGADWARAEYYAEEYGKAWLGLRFVFALHGDVSAPVPEGERSAGWGFGR